MTSGQLTGIAHRSATKAPAFRISPGDSNYFAVLFSPQADSLEQVMVVEIFQVGGRTPPNHHVSAHEFFYVLSGEGTAFANGVETALRQGDALVVRPGVEHVIENTGQGKLYTLTLMHPNEGLAELIAAGEPVNLDDEDRRVLSGFSSMSEDLR